MDLLRGHLNHINGSYMVNKDFLLEYINHGTQYLKRSLFRLTFHVSFCQACYDQTYLFGILQSVTRVGDAGWKQIICYESNDDGFLAWKDMVEELGNDGSLTLHIEKLNTFVNQPYHKSFPGGLLNFIERFQSSIEELGSLKSMYSTNETKLSTLILALRRSSVCIHDLTT